MVETLGWRDREPRRDLFDAMHADRKRVFVDWLGWDVPHRDGLEMDAYDDEHAVYLVAVDATGGHLGSVRLLETERGHILADLFPTLCDGPVPRGPRIREITRMCVSPGCPPDDRLAVRKALATALVRHAHATGLEGYTAVTDLGFMSRVVAAGWKCRALGLPSEIGGQPVAALMIQIDQASIAELRSAGTYEEGRGLLRPAAVAA